MSTAAMIGQDGQGGPRAAREGPAGTGEGRWSRWRRQVGGIVRLELGKVLFSRWSLIGWGLAFLPVLLVTIAMVGIAIARLRGETVGWSEQDHSLIFQALVLRLCVFFGCLAIFINLIRGEQHARTLHYYLLAPVRREVLVGGKFLGGWIGAALLFGGAALVIRFLQLIPEGWDAALRAVTGGPWLGLTLAYVGVTLLACLCYGAVFLWIGVLPVNPIGPAIFLFAWESANLFLPAVLQPFSVIYYLQSLLPVAIDYGPVAILTRPPSAPVALATLLGLAALLLGLAMRRARGLEASYGED